MLYNAIRGRPVQLELCCYDTMTGEERGRYNRVTAGQRKVTIQHTHGSGSSTTAAGLLNRMCLVIVRGVHEEEERKTTGHQQQRKWGGEQLADA